MNTPTIAVRFRGVSRRFGESAASSVVAVDNVSLDVRRGALTLVMGPSGSGKTTLLSLTAGLLAPNDGEIEVDAVRLASLHAAELSEFRLRKIGFIFQRFRLLEALSALENIELSLSLAGVRRPESRERAQKLLELVGMTDRVEVLAGKLSGGEQQRIAIARALANTPALILADEPTGSLDSRAGQRVIEMLRGIANDGVTVLVVSHDERLVPYADTVVRMEDGRVTSLLQKEV